MRVGTFYQFRIAAVSNTGTRGFQTLSTPVRLSKPPRPPTAPRNVSDGVWRIHAGGSISVQINWSPPAISDFPISSYKVSSTRRLRGHACYQWIHSKTRFV